MQLAVHHLELIVRAVERGKGTGQQGHTLDRDIAADIAEPEGLARLLTVVGRRRQDAIVVDPDLRGIEAVGDIQVPGKLARRQ
ncbi:hypothetical protein D3C72_2162780 [compost metagenome]